MQAATHDGVFHADDVTGAVILQLAIPEIAIIRTRDPQMITDADLAFDVGGGSYDHHQRGGNGSRPNGVPYASAGLLWREYGALICGTAAVATEVDRQLIQPIDAHDNGYQISTNFHADAQPCTISHVVSSFNPSWDEPQDFDARFWQVVAWMKPVLERAIVRARGVVEARAVVRQAVADAVDPRIVVLPYFVPWQEALVEASKDALLVVYPSAGTWRVQVVPKLAGQPVARTALPEAWAGLDGAALATLTGVPDATFCHRQRFIAGAVSLTGALTMARLAVA
jgi:uncharacterized UPF0160 family protein